MSKINYFLTSLVNVILNLIKKSDNTEKSKIFVHVLVLKELVARLAGKCKLWLIIKYYLTNWLFFNLIVETTNH